MGSALVWPPVLRRDGSSKMHNGPPSPARTFVFVDCSTAVVDPVLTTLSMAALTNDVDEVFFCTEDSSVCRVRTG